jgi:hypothetical protein
MLLAMCYIIPATILYMHDVVFLRVYVYKNKTFLKGFWEGTNM